jgi:hypothetical protein
MLQFSLGTTKSISRPRESGSILAMAVVYESVVPYLLIQAT